MSVMNQTYSYSRLSSFATCPYKWYETYVNKYKEPQRSYFAVGTICHEVAEFSADYCVKETWLNKADKFYYQSKELQDINEDNNDPLVFLEELYHNRGMLKGTEFRNFGNLSFLIDDKVSTEDYDIVSMPPRDVYDGFFDRAVANERVTDPEIIEEARYISTSFFFWYDFSLFPKEIMLAEKKLAFTKDWKKSGFFSDDAYYRGVIDNTIYTGEKELIITDYKTSRAMLTENQVKNDPQLNSYVKMMVSAMGRDAIESITIRIAYLRFKTVISHTFDGEAIDRACSTITEWIDNLVGQIESKGDDINNYECVRNQYCSRCHIREDGNCPIFQHVKLTGESSTASMNEELCKMKWKESEVLKDQYQAYQKECKEFIETTDGVVVIDDKAILDKHLLETKKYSPKAVVTFALSKGITLVEILDYLSISETNVKKLIKYNKLNPTTEELEEMYTTGTRTKFEALTREELE